MCRFRLAVDRPTRQGEEKKADFPDCICYEKQAENLARYQHKGSKIAVEGRLQTGSYEKQDGTKVYTTDVIVSRVEFLDSRNSEPKFEAVETDIPF